MLRADHTAKANTSDVDFASPRSPRLRAHLELNQNSMSVTRTSTNPFTVKTTDFATEYIMAAMASF